MRSTLNRHRLAGVVAATASTVLLAACATQPSSSTPSPTTTPRTLTRLTAGELLVSDGTNIVLIGDQKITFPTTVTDAAWSFDGSRIVFVDGDGAIATARPDGSDLLVVAPAKSGASRRRPVWDANARRILFDERTGNGGWNLMRVSGNGSRGLYDTGVSEAGQLFGDGPDRDNYSATSSAEPGPGRELAFVHGQGDVAEVWIADMNGRSPYGRRAVAGAEPALSPNGMKLAYVADGQINVLSTTDATPHPMRVTFGVRAPSHLTWSPDSTRIAFSTADDIESVATTVPLGADANPTTLIAAGPGVPSFLPPARDRISRLSAHDPVALAIAASRTRFATQITYRPEQTGREASEVALVSIANPAMALPLATVASGPTLFTSGSALDPRTGDEITRVLGRYTGPLDGAPRVVIVGDTSVISTTIEDTVRAMGYATRRIPGQDPSSLADAVMTHFYGGLYGDMLVVSADDVPALALVPSLIPSGQVLVAVDGRLSSAAKNALNHLDEHAKVYAVDAGAQTALAAAWSGKPATLPIIPVVGVRAMLDGTGGRSSGVVAVNTAAPADVIVAANYAAMHDGVVIAVDPARGPDPMVLEWLRHSAAQIDQVVVVDSTGAMPATIDAAIANEVCGPLGYGSGPLPDAS